MQDSLIVNAIVEANKEVIPAKYKLRYGRIRSEIYQKTFWCLLLTLLEEGIDTPNKLSVSSKKFTFSITPQQWQSFLRIELGLTNLQAIESFRHLLMTLLRGEKLQSNASYTTLISQLPPNTLTLIAFIGQATLRYFAVAFKESNYSYEEGQLTEYWYNVLYHFTTQPFEERVCFHNFCVWAHIRLKDNLQTLYRIPFFAFLQPAKQIVSSKAGKKLFSESKLENAVQSTNKSVNWSPEEIVYSLKNHDKASGSKDHQSNNFLEPKTSLFHSRFQQVLTALATEFEEKLARELEDFESSYEMLRREVVTLRDMEAQKTQEITISSLSELLDSLLRLHREELIQIEIETAENITRVFLDNINGGRWRLIGEIGEIIPETERDSYLPDPENKMSSSADGKLMISRLGLEIKGILLLRPYIIRREN